VKEKMKYIVILKKCFIFRMFEINWSFNIHVLKLPRYYGRAKIAWWTKDSNYLNFVNSINPFAKLCASGLVDIIQFKSIRNNGYGWFTPMVIPMMKVC
jgi:hypothetical protein